MKKFIRKTRLVYACINLVGGLFRLLAALVDMAFNYPSSYASQVDHSLRA